MKKQIPISAKVGPVPKQVVGGFKPNFVNELPCWRINKFDLYSKWGASAALGDFEFKYDESVLSIIVDSGDNKLNETLEKLNNKKLKSISNFWEHFNSLYKNPIQPIIVAKIDSVIGRSFFSQKIYPKLCNFEKQTWEEIERDTHGNENKSKHHYIKVDQIIKEARDRLDQLNLKDVDELFSLRLEGKLRIYGIRRLNYMEILWVDPNHEICPSKKR